MEASPLTAAFSDDTLFQGELICRQMRAGYRFSIDAVLVAHFVQPKADWRILDLGCGCGVIGLILAYRYPTIHLVGLELQPEVAAFARHNIEANSYTGRFSLIEGDARNIKKLLKPESCDLIVCNPPYYHKNSGRLNPMDQVAGSRHELHGDIRDFVRAAAFCCKNRGKVAFVYPARRGGTLLYLLQQQGLRPKRLQTVYSWPGAKQAELVLVEAMKNGGEELAVLAPLYIHSQRGGEYSPEMQNCYNVAKNTAHTTAP